MDSFDELYLCAKEKIPTVIFFTDASAEKKTCSAYGTACVGKHSAVVEVF